MCVSEEVACIIIMGEGEESCECQYLYLIFLVNLFPLSLVPPISI